MYTYTTHLKLQNQEKLKKNPRAHIPCTMQLLLLTFQPQLSELYMYQPPPVGKASKADAVEEVWGSS